MITANQFQRAVDQLAPWAPRLYLHVKGEPLLHPRLDDLLDRAHDAGLGVELVTNGTLLARWQEILLVHPALRRIHLSLQSLETLEAEAEALGAVLAFADRAQQAGLPVEFRSWKGTSKRQGTMLGPGRSLLTDAAFRWPTLDDPPISTSGFCLGLRDQIAVLVDGTVVPCCLDGEGVLALGNLYRQDLSEILAGPRAQALHRGFSDGRCVEPLCQRCQFRQRFDKRRGGAEGAEKC